LRNNEHAKLGVQVAAFVYDKDYNFKPAPWMYEKAKGPNSDKQKKIFALLDMVFPGDIGAKPTHELCQFCKCREPIHPVRLYCKGGGCGHLSKARAHKGGRYVRSSGAFRSCLFKQSNKWFLVRLTFSMICSMRLDPSKRTQHWVPLVCFKR
jgi:hypothetical protein